MAGPKGDRGDRGDTGMMGVQGQKGEMGVQGEYLRCVWFFLNLLYVFCIAQKTAKKIKPITSIKVTPV